LARPLSIDEADAVETVGLANEYVLREQIGMVETRFVHPRQFAPEPAWRVGASAPVDADKSIERFEVALAFSRTNA